jgi:hypothetical protein
MLYHSIASLSGHGVDAILCKFVGNYFFKLIDKLPLRLNASCLQDILRIEWTEVP